ncbi:MAG: PilZ domain-containing protein [Hyphomicrobiales bacterium]|nr:PilZ domain-containing protein [Hyphomicrobiales bacterium]
MTFIEMEKGDTLGQANVGGRVMIIERSFLRRRSILAGRIRINKNSTFDCLIRDLSPTGARLELAGGTELLPLQFELEIPKQNALHKCELRWRSEKAVGVSFTNSSGARTQL